MTEEYRIEKTFGPLRTARQVDEEAEREALPYRCPYCVDKGKDPCEHGREQGLNMDGSPLGPPGSDRGNAR